LEDEKGAYDMTRYLIDNGHKKIAFISDNKKGVDLARFTGYKAALKDAGIKFEEKDFLKIRPHQSEIEDSLNEICERAREYTAIMCVSDLYAVMLMSALYDRGIKVPDEISVVGFDDNDLGKYHRPALTTVHQDVKLKSVTAAETLIKIINGELGPNNQIKFPTELVIRDTVKKIN
nr:substrate-binding domain-containing protein [Butyrivibrio sp.]